MKKRKRAGREISQEELDRLQEQLDQLKEIEKLEEELRAAERERKEAEVRKRIEEAQQKLLKAKTERDDAIMAYKLGQGSFIASNVLIPLGILIFIAPVLTGVVGALGSFIAGAGIAATVGGYLYKEMGCPSKKVAELSEDLKKAEEEYQTALEYAASL